MALYDINGNVVSSNSESGSVSAITDEQITNDANIELSKLSNMEKTEETAIITINTDYKWTEGYYINTKGVLTENINYAVSDKVEVTNEIPITVTYGVKNLKAGIECYDSSDNYLGSVVDTDYSVIDEIITLTPLENTAYIRISINKNYVNGTSCVFTFESTISVYDFVDTSHRKVKELEVRKENNIHFSALDALLWNFTKWNGKMIVADGNSLVASTAWVDDLASFLGANYTNLGRSGYAIVYPTDTMDVIQTRVADDYPDTCDLILLQGDTNRSQDGEFSDQMDDADNPQTTWTAQMNYLIRCLKAKYHNVNIVLMPDSVRYDGSVQQYTFEKNRTSYEMMKGLAEYNRLAFFDFDHSTPFNPLYDDNYYSRMYEVGDTQDTVHPANYQMPKGYALAMFVAGLVFDPNAPNTATENWQDDIK